MVSLGPGVTRVRRLRVNRCRPLISATWTDKSEPGRATNAQHQCTPPHCSAAPVREPVQQQASARFNRAYSSQYFVPTAVQVPFRPRQRGDRPYQRPRQPLSTVQRASAQQKAPSTKVNSAIPPEEQKKTKTRTGWRCFPVGRGWVARYGGEPLAPRGARDEIVQVNKILPPWQPIGLDRVSRPFPPNRGA